MKCAKCGSERFTIEENEAYECRVKEGRIELVNSFGCDFENLFCYLCGASQKLDYSDFEFEYKF